MTTVNISEAKTHLSELLQRVSEGEEVIIARNGTPLARLVPLTPAIARRPGGWETLWIASDFDSADAEIAAMLLDEKR